MYHIRNVRACNAVANNESIIISPKKESPSKGARTSRVPDLNRSREIRTHIKKKVEENKEHRHSWKGLFIFCSKETDSNFDDMDEIKRRIDMYRYELDQKDLGFIASLSCPTLLVSQVFTAAMVALGKKDKSWVGIKAVLKSNFIESVNNYDFDKTDYATVKEIHSIIGSFTYDKLHKVGECVAKTFEWLRKIINYRAYFGVINDEPIPKELPKKKSPAKGSKTRPKTVAVSPKNYKREETKGSSNKPSIRAISVEIPEREINSWEDLLTLWSEDAELTPEKQEQINEEINNFSFNVDRKQITEMKALSRPPPAVEAVTNGVCVAFGQKKPNWKSGQALFANPNVAIKSIIDFDKDKVGFYTCKKIYSLIKDLTEDKVKCVSFAAVGLYSWLKVIIQYRAYLAVTNNEPVPLPKKYSPKRRSVITTTKTRFSITKSSSPFIEEEKVSIRTPVKSPFARLRKGRTSSPSRMNVLSKPTKITTWEDLIFDVDKEEFAKTSNKKNFLEKIFMFTDENVGKISPAQIKVLIHLRQPHEVLKKVASGLVTAFGVRDLSWGNIQSFFKGTNLLQDMLLYDKENIEFKTCKRIFRKINELDFMQVMNVSSTAFSFYSWLRCIIYSRVFEALQYNEAVPATKASPEKKTPAEEGEANPDLESSIKSTEVFEIAKEEEKVQTDARRETSSPSAWRDLYFLDSDEEDMTLEQFVVIKESLKKNRSSKLNKKDISEIALMKKPPTVVQKVLKGLMVAFGHLRSYDDATHSWRSAMWFIEQKSFFKLISEFDADHVEYRTCRKIHSHINDLTEEMVAESSRGALTFYRWLKNLLNYRVYLALSNEESASGAEAV